MIAPASRSFLATADLLFLAVSQGTLFPLGDGKVPWQEDT